MIRKVYTAAVNFLLEWCYKEKTGVSNLTFLSCEFHARETQPSDI